MSDRPFKNLIVALDLEMNQPSGRIIQVGAVVGDVVTGDVVDRFDALVNPGEPLDERIAKLTGHTPEAIAAAAPLAQAGAKLQSWLEPFADARTLNPLTWGGGDTETLREQLQMSDERWMFGRRWIDVKTLYAAWRMAHGKEVSGGLAKAMTKLKLAFKGRKHNALDDALNTFRMYRALLQQFRVSDEHK